MSLDSFVKTIHSFTHVTLLRRINRGVANTPDVIAGGDHYLRYPIPKQCLFGAVGVDEWSRSL